MLSGDSQTVGRTTTSCNGEAEAFAGNYSQNIQTENEIEAFKSLSFSTLPIKSINLAPWSLTENWKLLPWIHSILNSE
jgi:hypothetical protein